MTDLDAPVVAASPRHRGTLPALLEATRPRQWVKNLLVVAAPLAAAELLDPGVARATAVAFLSFLLAAAGSYLVNDVRDVDEDRRHPLKRLRPVARGDVPEPVALAVAAALLAGSLLLPLATGHGALAVTVAVYVALTQCYSVWWKHEPVVDLAVVASGFLLRAVAGGVAAGLPLSQWFLIVASFGSLFMVAGKRYSELVVLGDRAAEARRSLALYSPSYLRFVWTTAAAVLLTAYCLWAFEVGDATADRATAPWSVLSVAPFVLAVLRYARDVDAGVAGEPEETVLADRGLLVIGTLWLVTFTLGAAGA